MSIDIPQKKTSRSTYIKHPYDLIEIDGFVFYSDGDRATHFDGDITEYVEIPNIYHFDLEELNKTVICKVRHEKDNVYSWERYYSHQRMIKISVFLRFFTETEEEKQSKIIKDNAIEYKKYHPT